MKNGIYCISVFLYLVLMLMLGALAIHYDVSFWASYIQHKPVNIPYLPCYIASLFVGGPAIVVAVLTWVLSFVL